MVDYFEKLSGGFPRRPNFARRNLMERQKSIPAGYKLPAPRPHQYGSASTYSSSYAYGYVTSGKLHAGKTATPRPPNTAPIAATPAITGTDQHLLNLLRPRFGQQDACNLDERIAPKECDGGHRDRVCIVVVHRTRRNGWGRKWRRW